MGTLAMIKALLYAGIVFAATSTLPAQDSSSIQEARVIYSRTATPIVSMLREDDKFVVVRRGNVISQFVDNYVPSLKEDLDGRVRAADAIAIVELDKSASFLAEQDAWIRSKVTLKPVQIIKPAKPWLVDLNRHVTVDHDGGELTIKNVRVRAGRYYELFPNQRYLVFLRSPREGYIGFVGMQLKISQDERIVPIDLSDGNVATAESPLYGLPLHNVVAELRRRLTP